MRNAFPAEDPAEARRLRLVGVGWIALLAVLVGLSIATYAKAFDGHVTVRVLAPRAGMQLNPGGDVRMNGAIVGRIAKVTATRTGASVEVQLDGDAADRIPSSTTARILPTTLFGQKYVELRSGADPDEGHVVEGSVLRSDPDASRVELTDVLDNLEPVLTTLRPAELSTLLHGLSQGLDGQGRELGRLVDDSGAYLADLNRLSPQLVRDLRLLARVSGQYADNVPAFLDLLDQSTTFSDTLTQGTRWADLLTGVTSASREGQALLAASRRNLDEATRLSRPTLELLAEYSPEFPCVIDGFLGVRDSSAAQIKGASVEGYFTIGRQVRGYDADDKLRMGDLGTGPRCRGLPNPPVPYPAVDIDDGVSPEIDDSANPDSGGSQGAAP